MKTSMLAVLVLGAAAFSLLTGCVERPVYVQGPPVAAPPPAEGVVSEAPPPPPAEVYGVAPGPAYVWVPGAWTWHGRWVWMGGRWMARPHPHAVYVPGHWRQRGHGWVWIGGYWR